MFATVSPRVKAGGAFIFLALSLGAKIGVANRHSPRHDAVYVALGLAGVIAVLAPLVFLALRSEGRGRVSWSQLPLFYAGLAAWAVVCCLVAWVTWSL